MDDRALGVLNPMGDDWTFAASYISQPLPWEQWCSIDQLGPFGSSQDETSTVNSVYAPTVPSPPNSFVYRSDTRLTDVWSDNNPMTESPNLWGSDIPVTEISPSSMLSEPNLRQKRNHDTNRFPSCKPDRRSSSRDIDMDPLAKEKTQHASFRGNRSARGNNAYAVQQRNDDMKRARERNRLAANKFRAKQRDDLLRLESSEQDLERIHRDLSTCVADLTLEIYMLKMELLQHSGCNCALIQNYLAHESQRYVQALKGGIQREATSRQPEQPGRSDQGQRRD
ncbi:BZIP domain-containing protein [Fusarium falciforme]|uniref:BZIP domain-containing protein n=1 Tax=Fusarium falciforme TaxID=195108 RepID=UPI0023008710|nr:BZIP domain-containing protein [Fusarium falciforme]WAO97212.1 BZIP domain-containing protein [Fusarium falciforme]